MGNADDKEPVPDGQMIDVVGGGYNQNIKSLDHRCPAYAELNPEKISEDTILQESMERQA